MTVRKDFWDSYLGHWPMADQRLSCNDPLNNCGTHFGSSPLLVSKAANVLHGTLPHLKPFLLLQVGPSGSIFGVIACLFVELFQSWQIIARPVTALLKLCGLVLLLLVIGLLPYVDNFAHMIGFVFGFLLAFIFLPYVSFGEFDRRRKQIQIVVCFTLVITLYVVGFLVFYIYQGSSCDGCEFLNCIPFTPDFCKPYTLGQNLQPRTR